MAHERPPDDTSDERDRLTGHVDRGPEETSILPERVIPAPVAEPSWQQATLGASMDATPSAGRAADVCPSCGNRLPAESRFCQACGARIAGDSAEPEHAGVADARRSWFIPGILLWVVAMVAALWFLYRYAVQIGSI